jgi:alginate O-acetyltransferase complex protein AlgI
MVFSSPLFLFAFCPLFFISFFLVPAKYKDAIIIIGSIFFYAWGANYFVLIVLATCIIDYKLGALIYNLGNAGEKKLKYKLYIFIDVLINAGILLYFKYANFFVDNINALFAVLHLDKVIFTKVILPIGISFVIFQKMTYCLDIAKGMAKPAEFFFRYVEYLFLFPALIAGPILRYNLLAPQFDNKKISFDNVEEGFKRFSVGLAKKVLIADTVAKYADIVFNGPAGLIPVQYTWIGLACYTLQIYFDFSAYSDMAIGMLKIMGFTIPENFNRPYISKSITEFWKRWHISLTSWMREYLYIPLGGNRKGTTRMYFNLWVVFLISGFWHGASWNFVVWGIFHGSLLCLERLYILKQMERLPNLIRLGITLFLVMIGWVFFRTDNIGHSFGFLRQMFNFSSISIHTPPERILLFDNWGIFIIFFASVLCILPFFEKINNALLKFKARHPQLNLILCFLLFFLATMKVGTASFSPFIYFRF